MSPKVFLAWLVVTVVTVAAAVFVTLGQPGTTSVRLDNEPALPGLRDNPDAVAALELSGGGQRFALARGEDGRWTAPDKHGYPVDGDKVRTLIVGLSDMRLIEAKTAREDRLARLQLEDPEGAEAQSRLLTLKDGDGGLLGRLVVGKGLSRQTGRVEGGTYVRRAEESQAWLASGRIEPGASLEEWLDDDVVHLPSTSILTVEMSPLEGEKVVLARAEADGAFALEGLPEGRELDASRANRLASGLAFLTFDDVQPRDQLELGVVSHHGVYRDEEGLQVTVELVPAGEATWAIFDAAAVEVDGQDEAARQAIADKAKTIEERVSPWAYKLPDYALERLKTSFESLHKAAEAS